MVIIGWVITSLYLFLLAAFLSTWSKLRLEGTNLSHTNITNFSIIIPVRNEEENILKLLQDISDQRYPNLAFEVIVVNDSSTDSTRAIVSDFIKARPNFFLLDLHRDEALISHKKKALEKAIAQSSGKFIITTDGDCRVGPDWLNSINTFITTHNPICLCGPVTYVEDDKPFTRLQIIEFAALLGSGAATTSMGFPGMCNGANLIYKKDAFLAVEGFKGIDNIASGDDELLMHKLLKAYPGNVFFLKNQDAMVHTKANKNWNGFYNQRKRWASKWEHYKDVKVQVLAVFIFITNFYFALAPVLIWADLLAFHHLVVQWLIKLLLEGFFILGILKFLKKKIHLFHLLILQIVYPYYTSFFGIVANFGGYVWKGRQVKKKIK